MKDSLCGFDFCLSERAHKLPFKTVQDKKSVLLKPERDKTTQTKNLE